MTLKNNLVEASFTAWRPRASLPLREHGWGTAAETTVNRAERDTEAAANLPPHLCLHESGQETRTPPIQGVSLKSPTHFGILKYHITVFPHLLDPMTLILTRRSHVLRWQELPGLTTPSSAPSSSHWDSLSNKRFFDSLSGLIGKGWFEPILKRGAGNLVNSLMPNGKIINKQQISIPSKYVRATQEVSALWKNSIFKRKICPQPPCKWLSRPKSLYSALPMKTIRQKEKKSRGQSETHSTC